MNLDGLKSVSQTIEQLNIKSQADVRRSSDLRPRYILRIPLILDTAATEQNPYIISSPFNGAYLEQTSGVNTTIFMSLGGYDQYSVGNPVRLQRNASFYTPTEIKSCNLTWSAQTNQTAVLVLFLGVDFRPGSQLSILQGGISISGGTSIQTGTLGAGGIAGNVSVPAGAATQLCPINLNRTQITFYTDQAIWVGDSSAAINNGTLIAAGSTWQFQNTGELWAAAAAATATVSGSEELL